MPKITLPQKKIAFVTPSGTNLMKALLANNIPVASSCLGDGICGKCRMTVVGEVTEASEIEIQTRLRNQIPETERLACQLTVENDLIVSTSYW